MTGDAFTVAFLLAGGFVLFLCAIWYIERRGNRVARRKAKQKRRKIKLWANWWSPTAVIPRSGPAQILWEIL